ncbi:hypothetical protein [Pontibacter litorisediminis]|uniref:hypothetical protein n=1 Tax=Pontibacter litorisediminis TaxID=1846260 RepID=UPI0023ED77D1|nr:hypothetical protein [Pontibacter litorisediminis]
MVKLLFKITVVVLITVFSGTEVLAQYIQVPKDIQGRRLRVKDHSALKGSPYLYDAWSNGLVKLMNGLEFEGQIMYDQLEDQVVFNGGDGEPQEFVDPVYEFTIREKGDDKANGGKKFRKGYPVVDGGDKSTFYEILAEGNVTLLKRTKKTIVEQVPYGSSVKEQHVKSVETYFIATPTEITKIKNSKKGFLEAFGSQSSELEAYAKKNRIDFKTDLDLAKLVTYYNSL